MFILLRVNIGACIMIKLSSFKFFISGIEQRLLSPKLVEM